MKASPGSMMALPDVSFAAHHACVDVQAEWLCKMRWALQRMFVVFTINCTQLQHPIWLQALTG